jgi:hypothetical protein
VYPEDENRLTPRQPYDQIFKLERSLFFPGEGAPVFEIGQVLDISPLGMGIKTDLPLEPKEMVRVSLPFPVVGIPLPVYYEVRWVTGHNQQYRAGLQFIR